MSYAEHLEKYAGDYSPKLPISKDNRYNGWYLVQHSETEPDGDCSKIYHVARSWPSGDVPIDWTPYEFMTDEEFKLWIELKMPGRISAGPLRTEDLWEIAKEYMNNDGIPA